MKKIAMIYFSGTGNTEKILNIHKLNFIDNGFGVDVYKVEELLKDEKNFSPEQFEYIGFGYPVYGFSVPVIVKKYLKKLPKCNGIKTFIFKTAGDDFLYGGSNKYIRKKLRKKGYNVIHEDLYVMASNIVRRYSDEIIKQLYEYAKKKNKKSIDEILNNNIVLQKGEILSNLATGIVGRIDYASCRIFGKRMKVDRNCTNCMKCEMMCPTSNISSKDNKVIFGKNCISCMRCVYNCPENAINTPLKFIKIQDWYDLEKIINDNSLEDKLINKQTKGYYKRFYNYLNNIKE